MKVTIRSDRLTVDIQSLGAELASVRSADGIEYLWQGNPAHWSGRAPILFPYVGRLRGGRAESACGPVVGGGHGFARRAEWTLTDKSDTAVTFTLQDSEETRAQYPYAFSLSLTYMLEGTTLYQIFTVSSPGKVPLPYCLGGHPAFNVPLCGQEHFEDYFIQFDRRETADCPQVDLAQGLILSARNRFLTDSDRFSLNHVLFRGDALIFDSLRSSRVRLCSSVSGHGVELDMTGFGILGIWSPQNDAPFVCLEPWTGCATKEDEDDCFEHKTGMAQLSPGERAEKRFSLRFF